MDRFIVTGGAGFIGSNLVRSLNALGSDRILIVDHLNHPGKEANLKPLRFEDVIDKNRFRELIRAERAPKVSAVFHLGACSSTTVTDERYLQDNNTEYTRELCEWAIRHGVRFIYASSAATYGDGRRGYSDDDAVTPTLEPLNAYGRSKHQFDLWALHSGALRQIAGLKYFNVYGPGEGHKGEMRSMVHKSFHQVQQEGVIRLFRSYRPDVRDGEQKRDFVYVEDAVAMTLFFFEHPEVSGLFNCGTGVARTWLDLAHAVFSAMGREPKIEFVEMPPAIRAAYQYFTQADMTKARRAGYTRPFCSLEEGVRRYIQTDLMPRTS